MTTVATQNIKRGAKKRRLSLRDRFRVLRKPTKRIVVVGGGLAGLSAAFELESLGYEVLVFEAQREVGGRTRSSREIVRGKIVEKGAELIGLNHLAWWSYKRKFGLRFSRISDPKTPPIFLGGKRICDQVAAGLAKEMRLAQLLINRAARVVDSHEPWNSPGARALDGLSLVDAMDKLPISPLCRMAFLEQLQADNGVDANLQSWLGNLAMIKGGGGARYWTDTETHRCKEGTQALALEFAKRLKCVMRTAPVKQLRILKNKVVVVPWKGKPVEADDVVLAIPPTLWRREIKIEPPLPRSLRVQFGRNIKYLLNVRRGSWNPEGVEMSSDGPIDLTWEGTDGQAGARACFVAFSGGNNAEICKRWKRRKVRYLRVLAPIYPGLRAKSREGVLADWLSDRWTRGSYSFPKPLEVSRVGPTLRAGFRHRLHFAGEHTCYAFTGYMEGALQSGLRVAEDLARRDKVIR